MNPMFLLIPCIILLVFLVYIGASVIRKEKALFIGEGTLVYYMDNHPDEEVPLGRGNCFSVLTSRLREVKIINIGQEDLVKVMRLRNITFPLDMKVAGKGFGIITDSRIPKNWFLKDYCTICTPGYLLSKAQQDKRAKEYQRSLKEGRIKIIVPRSMEQNVLKLKEVIPKISLPEIVYQDKDDSSVFIVEKKYSDTMETSYTFGAYTEFGVVVDNSKEENEK